MAQNQCNDRGILTALYTLKFTRDPLINRSLLCKNPRILKGDFQLFKYNIDVMEKYAFSKVFILFHYSNMHGTSKHSILLLYISICIFKLTDLYNILMNLI